MKRPRLLSSLLLLICAATAQARQPNVIFIVADDLGPGDLGCYGQKIIQTPNLDRMAAEGMRFTQHYAGNAVCAPSRCVLMTGKHPGHAAIRDNRQPPDAKNPSHMGRPEKEGQHPLPADELTLAEHLKKLGYSTGGFGKWGLGGPDSLGAPLKQGFDRWFGYNCQGVAHNFYPTYLWDNDKVVELKNPPFPSIDKLTPAEDPAKPESYARFQGTEYSADLITEQALQFAKDNRSRPFFLYWPTTVPHLALQVPEESSRAYAGKFDDPPYPGGKGYLPHFTPKAAYAGMITRMDRDIGRMMKLIADLDLEKDTLFVFVSDNGPLNGTHAGLGGTDCAFFNSAEGRRDGKGTLYEGGIRTPCIVRWKGMVPPGTTSSRVTGFEDWMPTLGDLCSEAKPASIGSGDGISFASTLRGEQQSERPFLYREFPGYGGQQMLRLGDWKLVRTQLVPKAAKAGKKPATAPLPKEELFNLASDPGETTDVAAQHPDMIRKMKDTMAAQHANSTDFPMTALDK